MPGRHYLFDSSDDHSAVATPGPPKDGVEFVGPLSLWKLEALLTANPSDPALAFATSPLTPVDGAGRVIAVNPRLIEALLELSSDDLYNFAHAWYWYPELHWDEVNGADEADDYLQAFAVLAHEAAERKHGVYMWWEASQAEVDAISSAGSARVARPAHLS